MMKEEIRGPADAHANSKEKKRVAQARKKRRLGVRMVFLRDLLIDPFSSVVGLIAGDRMYIGRELQYRNDFYTSNTGSPSRIYTLCGP